MAQTHLVFVYGTLKRGFSNHVFLEKAAFVGRARTCGRYALYEGDYPFVVKDPPVSRILGELYEVDDPTLARLDRLEEHPDYYRREQVDVETASGKRRTAWLYFFPRPQGTLVPGGEWTVQQVFHEPPSAAKGSAS